jgi:hypothetical protein
MAYALTNTAWRVVLVRRDIRGARDARRRWDVYTFNLFDTEGHEYRTSCAVRPGEQAPTLPSQGTREY